MATAWLDRLAPGSSPASRRGSPAPRNKPAPLPTRPGLDSRTTTLSSLVRSSSYSSSLITAGRTEGVASRHISEPSPGARNPLDVLGEILGKPVDETEEEGDDTENDLDIDKLEDDIDFGGLSLNEYLEAPASKQPSAQITVRSIQTAEECR